MSGQFNFWVLKSECAKKYLYSVELWLWPSTGNEFEYYSATQGTRFKKIDGTIRNDATTGHPTGTFISEWIYTRPSGVSEYTIQIYVYCLNAGLTFNNPGTYPYTIS